MLEIKLRIFAAPNRSVYLTKDGLVSKNPKHTYVVFVLSDTFLNT